MASHLREACSEESVISEEEELQDRAVNRGLAGQQTNQKIAERYIILTPLNEYSWDI